MDQSFVPRLLFKLCLAVWLLILSSFDVKGDDGLRHLLESFVADKDFRCGIGVIFDGQDTTMVRGSEDFPMLSVYKFPQAIAVAEFCNERGMGLNDTLFIPASTLSPDTYSPMREKYGQTDLRLPLSELLDYSIRESDNNACDILFNLIGSPVYADSIMKSMSFRDINIRYTEDEMHKDVMLCYLNSATPQDMCSLIEIFTDSLVYTGEIHKYVSSLMETCLTGKDRLPSPLPENVRLGHKTGTGDRNNRGQIIGVNDVGYIFLPDGRKITISVFIADSLYSLDETSGMIGEISRIVYEYYSDSFIQ